MTTTHRLSEAPRPDGAASAPLLDRPIFILGCHKSGTSFLRALLDGHEDLFVIPRETHFFQYAGYPVRYALRSSPGFAAEGRTLWERMRDHISREQCTPAGPCTDSPGFDGYPFEKLAAYLEPPAPKCPREEFETYVRGLHYALFGTDPAAGLRIVEKSVEHAEFAPLLRQWYSDSRFIHIVRNPYANLVSLRRFKSRRRRYPRMRRLCESLRTSYECLFENRHTMSGYLVVRYEDLVQKPESVMQRIAEFLELSFSECLVRPTQLGRPWRGNSTSSTPCTGVDARPASRWRAEISDFEIALVNATARRTLDEFSYERLTASWRHALPQRGERPLGYLANRRLLGSLDSSRAFRIMDEEDRARETGILKIHAFTGNAGAHSTVVERAKRAA